jgi:hypothetical protein
MRDILYVHKIEKRKANWIGYILGRKCLLKHVIYGNEEGRVNLKGREKTRSKLVFWSLMT